MLNSKDRLDGILNFRLIRAGSFFRFAFPGFDDYNDLNVDLCVVWIPDPPKSLSGEVKNKTIYIYELDEKDAVKVLRHEFLDYCVSQAIEPYRNVTNRLIKMINEDAYKRKEKIVVALTRLVD